MVRRRVLGQKAPRRHNAARVPKANHPRRAHAPLRVPAQVHDIPAHDHGPDGEATQGDEADAEIAHVEAVVGG